LTVFDFVSLISAENVIIEKNVKLIVVDSIASLARKEFDVSSMVTRQRLLSKIAAILKRYAEIFHIPVIVTNQVLGTGHILPFISFSPFCFS
jgi:RAD51-like protein 1